MSRYIGAIDQGTTSSRFIVFDKAGTIVSVAQKEHAQIYPQPGWVEHDPAEIWRNTQEVIGGALAREGLHAADLAAVGITNQRETTVLWDRKTGKPLHNALVWQDTRTAELVGEYARDGGQDRFRARTGCRSRPTSAGSSSSGCSTRARRARESGSRRRAVRHDRHVGALESHGRPVRRACTSRTSRTRAARSSSNLATLDLGRRAARRVRRFRGDAAAHSAVERGLRQGRDTSARRRAARGHPRRPAGRARRADVLRSRAKRRTPTAPAASC